MNNFKTINIYRSHARHDFLRRGDYLLAVKGQV